MVKNDHCATDGRRVRNVQRMTDEKAMINTERKIESIVGGSECGNK